MIFETLARLADDLDSFNVPWALVGGLACNVYLQPRFTHDIDVAVALDVDAEQDRLVLDLQARGYRFFMPPIDRLDIEGIFGVRLVPPGQRISPAESGEPHGEIVDLIFKGTGIEAEIVAAAKPLEISSGLILPVAARGHLLASKVLSWRDKDLGDAKGLLRLSDHEDLAMAREALEKMERLGLNRKARTRRGSTPQSLLARLEGLIHEVEHGLE